MLSLALHRATPPRALTTLILRRRLIVTHHPPMSPAANPTNPSPTTAMPRTRTPTPPAPKRRRLHSSPTATNTTATNTTTTNTTNTTASTPTASPPATMDTPQIPTMDTLKIPTMIPKIPTMDTLRTPTMDTPKTPTMGTLKTPAIDTPKTPTIDTPQTPRIELTETEETVRRLLVDVGAEIDTYNRTTGARNKDPVVLRFTGGWVRDKLLGIPSHDIDVGISRMTGYNFGLYLVGFLQRHYHSYGIEPGAVHRIDSNPEKSKHLETATMKILGLDIDLVNLRSEVYKGDSRVPIMEFGTPTEDALRRDCTVNALFYNLHTRRVEDMTGHGLADMRNGIIRTPLPPHETFDDDPLRILRLVRFSARLGFAIVPEARQAMMLPDIIDALRHKISRERIGDELNKMLSGPDPHHALTLLYEHSLYPAIFASPSTPFPPLPLHTLPLALAATKHLNMLPTPLLPTAHDRHLSWLLAALTPWAHAEPDPAAKRGTPAAVTAARDGIKAVNKTTDVVSKAIRHVGAVRAVLAEGAEAWGRARIGRFIKEVGAAWRSCVFMSELLELVDVWGDGGDTPTPEAQRIIDRYESLAARITELGMEEAYLVKPLVNGNELMEMFAHPRGAWIARAAPKILEWQWDHPAAGRDEALAWVKTQREALLREV